MVEQDGARVLIDASPDLRYQLLRARIGDVSAVLFTHVHADHVHGIDDLRAVKRRRGVEIDVYGSTETIDLLRKRFAYAFEGAGFYTPTLRGHVVEGPFTVAGIQVTPFDQGHGDETTTGYRLGPVAYSTDVDRLEAAAFGELEGVEVWIVDCLRMSAHPTHAHFDRTLEWIERVRPRRAVLTHLGISMDYAALAARCPEGVEPAFDGMVIDV
jgi:phosphoribosyl 1,2-cyclic phosphate phosphodiesterase